MRGRILVISGPSGVGKTSVCQRLVQDPRFVPSISATTRPARPGEVPGVHYVFLSEEEFRGWIARGRFLEWAEVYGRFYGTPREPLDRLLAAGKLVVLNIDVQGAARLREEKVDAIYIFLVPPTPLELERRLRARRTESEDAIARRLALAAFEMKEAHRYDQIVVNDDLERAADEIRRIALGAGEAGHG
jgi:guanylate kinase